MNVCSNGVQFTRGSMCMCAVMGDSLQGAGDFFVKSDLHKYLIIHIATLNFKKSLTMN